MFHVNIRCVTLGFDGYNLCYLTGGEGEIPKFKLSFFSSIPNAVDDFLETVLFEKAPKRTLHQIETYLGRDRELNVALFVILPQKSLKLHDLNYSWKKIETNTKPTHPTVVQSTLNYLRNTLPFTHNAIHFLEESFSYSELQSAYEAVLCKKVDVRNFRKKMDALNILEKADEVRSGVSHRPSQLYRFVKPQNESTVTY